MHKTLTLKAYKSTIYQLKEKIETEEECKDTPP